MERPFPIAGDMPAVPWGRNASRSHGWGSAGKRRAGSFLQQVDAFRRERTELL